MSKIKAVASRPAIEPPPEYAKLEEWQNCQAADTGNDLHEVQCICQETGKWSPLSRKVGNAKLFRRVFQHHCGATVPVSIFLKGLKKSTDAANNTQPVTTSTSHESNPMPETPSVSALSKIIQKQDERIAHLTLRRLLQEPSKDGYVTWRKPNGSQLYEPQLPPPVPYLVALNQFRQRAQQLRKILDSALFM